MSPTKIWAMAGLLLIWAGCSLTGGPLQSTMGGEMIAGQAKTLPGVDTGRQRYTPIPARVLLVIPKEFEQAEYTGMYLGKAVHHRLGVEGENQLRNALGEAFTEVRVRPVENEDAARKLILPDGEFRTGTTDLIAIPRFIRIESADENGEYHFRLELMTEFVISDGSSLRVFGRGESVTGKYVVSTPEQSAVLTLQAAVSALLDRIEKRRSFFIRS